MLPHAAELFNSAGLPSSLDLIRDCLLEPAALQDDHGSQDDQRESAWCALRLGRDHLCVDLSLSPDLARRLLDFMDEACGEALEFTRIEPMRHSPLVRVRLGMRKPESVREQVRSFAR